MNIPEEAVEAAARAMADASPDVSQWSDLNELEVARYMRDAREALEAAAPILEAQFWAEAEALADPSD